MKSLNLLTAILAISFAVNSVAATTKQSANKSTASNQSLKSDFDSLGDNAAIAERAQALDPNNKVKIVQNRLVDRNYRLEVGVNAGLVAGGDNYYKSQNLGANMDFHFSPRWSLGARYTHSYNTLTPEGKSVFDDAAQRQAAGDKNFRVPDIDYPIDTYLGVISWYPIYGKLNLLDLGVAHFDFYFLGGYGKTALNSGFADTITAGAGLGVWMNQHLTFRLEGRYQTYEDQVYSGKRRLDTAVVMAAIGFML